MDRRVIPPERVTSPTRVPHLHVNKPLMCRKKLWGLLMETKIILLYQEICLAAKHVSENDLKANPWLFTIYD